MTQLPQAVLMERALLRVWEDAIGYQGCPSPGNPHRITTRAPAPPFTVKNEVKNDEFKLAATKLLTRDLWNGDGDYDWNIFREPEQTDSSPSSSSSTSSRAGSNDAKKIVRFSPKNGIMIRFRPKRVLKAPKTKQLNVIIEVPKGMTVKCYRRTV